jgi:hypothetical protein
MRDLTNLSNEQLEQFRRNALATDYGCIGHNKSHWNHAYFRAYTDELIKRGVELPDIDGFELAKLGVYNGEGSY